MMSAVPFARPSPWFRPLWLGLLLAHLAVVASVRHWPSQDGPSHAYNAVLLLEMNRPDRPAYHRFFQVNPRPVPNWAAAAVTVGLLKVVPPAVADKLIVGGCLIAFYAAAAYAVGGLRPAAPFAPLVVLPLGLNLFVFLGFYNFAVSLPVLLLVYGYWLRHGRQPTLANLLVLAGLGTLLYFCHLVSFGLAGCFLGVLAVAAMIDGQPGRLWRAVGPLLAMSPPVVLSAVFLGRQRLDPNGSVSLAQRLQRLATWGDALSRPGAAVSAAVMAALALATAVALYRRGRLWSPADGLLVTAAVAAALSLLAPDVMSGGSYIVRRLGLIAALTWAVWVAGQPLPARLGQALAAMATVATVVLLAFNARVVRAEDRFVTAYQSAAAAVPPDATYMPISYASKVEQSARGRPPFRLVDCMLHADAWLAIDRHAVDVTDYEAWTGYFPTRFRPGLDPLAVVHSMTPSRYAAVTGDWPQYVILWTGGLAPARDVDQAVAADLARDYVPVFRSPGDGYTQVYRRR